MSEEKQENQERSPKIAVITASLGGYDPKVDHEPQSMKCDIFTFTDENMSPRTNAMTPRLQAKIPKCFGWQLAPGYDYYLWIDGTFRLSHPDAVKYFYGLCQGYDLLVYKHPRRPDVRQEARYVRKGIKQQARYLYSRYKNEMLADQMAEITANKDFRDDFLAIGGVFMYRNTPKIQNMLKEWWYHISRYLIMDQLSFSYVIKTSGVKFHLRPEIYDKLPYLTYRGHKATST